MARSRAPLVRWLGKLLKPVVAFALRHSLHFQDVEDALKRAFLDAAKEQIERSGHKANVSRLSVATGLHRRDVTRLTNGDGGAPEPRGLVSRVIGQWQSDPRFTVKAGRPRALSIDGEGSEMRALLTSVSQDVNHATIYAELVRIGAIKERGKKAYLLKRAYVTRSDLDESYGLLAKDMLDLSSAVDENLQSGENRHLHARTEYDNVRQDKIAEIRRWLVKEGSEFHSRAREYLSKFDLDIVPAKGRDGGARVSLGSFSFIDVNDNGGEDHDS